MFYMKKVCVLENIPYFLIAAAGSATGGVPCA
jgi:hypothetical protein